jgi:hypothetical protein
VSAPTTAGLPDDHAIQQAATLWLTERLRNLPRELGIQAHSHFLCGISQIAIGADHAFTRACQELGIPQRISLPQPSDVYLAAEGSQGPDFDPQQKREAEALLASPHIIQETVVATTASRHVRFEEANIELVRQSDVMIAMVRDEDASGGKRGGTWDVVRQARLRGVPVLVVRFRISGGVPVFEAKWEKDSPAGAGGSALPSLPEVLQAVAFESPMAGGQTIPPRDAYFDRIKNHCSQEANRFSKFFQSSAFLIIGTHTAATACALLALALLKKKLPEVTYYSALVLLLAVEVALLCYGFFRHHALHKQEAASRWAMHRLLSEAARSVIAFGRYHIGFDHFRSLHLPDPLSPLLRTMEILHLRSTRTDACTDWRECRDAYVTNRLTKPKAQLDFYRDRAHKAEKQHHQAHVIFSVSSCIAILSTLAKLIFVIMVIAVDAPAFTETTQEIVKRSLGFFGVLLPVIAVAALSYAAAHDLEARAHTFSEMYEFLQRQTELLNQVQSEREFARLLHETETRLLGETVTWYSRRAFTGVA